jgi:hypothetical protein
MKRSGAVRLLRRALLARAPEASHVAAHHYCALAAQGGKVRAATSLDPERRRSSAPCHGAVTSNTLRSRPAQAAAPASAALQRLAREPWAASPLRSRGYAAAGGGGGRDADAEAGGSGSAAEGDEAPTVEQLTAELQEREKAVEELQSKARGRLVGLATGPASLRSPGPRGRARPGKRPRSSGARWSTR